MLMVNDLVHIVKAVMGKTPAEAAGTIVLGDVPNEGCHPQFRIDSAVAAEDPHAVIDGKHEYLYLVFTDLGTLEHPLKEDERKQWEMWVLTYGPKPKDWNIHIPNVIRVDVHGNPIRMPYDAVRDLT